MPSPMREALLVGASTVEADGQLAVPTGPGLGVDVSPEALRTYSLDV
jgi:L-alanine-DL-glutamate epimerase-like enolase superfamily enzyme